jgi:hypothetical protein
VYSRVEDGLARASGQDQLRFARNCAQVLQDGDRLSREGNAMRAPHLHPSSREARDRLLELGDDHGAAGVIQLDAVKRTRRPRVGKKSIQIV